MDLNAAQCMLAMMTIVPCRPNVTAQSESASIGNVHLSNSPASNAGEECECESQQRTPEVGFNLLLKGGAPAPPPERKQPPSNFVVSQVSSSNTNLSNIGDTYNNHQSSTRRENREIIESYSGQQRQPPIPSRQPQRSTQQYHPPKNNLHRDTTSVSSLESLNSSFSQGPDPRSVYDHRNEPTQSRGRAPRNEVESSFQSYQETPPRIAPRKNLPPNTATSNSSPQIHGRSKQREILLDSEVGPETVQPTKQYGSGFTREPGLCK